MMTRALMALLLLFFGVNSVEGEELATLDMQIDYEGQPLPCRIHIKNAQGKPEKPANLGLPYWHDHFVCDGRVRLSLKPGRYTVETERGPEWKRALTTAELKVGESQKLLIVMSRLVDLTNEHWYSGDLHIHRAVEDLELLAKAEDLRIAPAITWWNQTNLWSQRPLPKSEDLLKHFDIQDKGVGRFTQIMSGEDERGGGALLYFHLSQPLDITKAKREHPTSVRFAAEAKRLHPEVWIDMEKPFWNDAPLWLAHGVVDSVGIANNHMQRSGMLANEAWGRPRDTKTWPDPLGNGFWTQEIYYQMLNAGFRIPPSAGSASGVLANPVGYNRVYVQMPGRFSYEKWWGALRAGRVFVTNGPLLRVQANGQSPGYSFQDNQPSTINLAWKLDSNDPIDRIEIIKDGKIAQTLPPTAQNASITFEQTGWFLVRAFANNKQTFRFASTGPYHVQIGNQPQIIRKSAVKFFLDWQENRRQSLSTSLTNIQERAEVLADHDQALKFWTQRAAIATPDNQD